MDARKGSAAAASLLLLPLLVVVVAAGVAVLVLLLMAEDGAAIEDADALAMVRLSSLRVLRVICNVVLGSNHGDILVGGRRIGKSRVSVRHPTSTGS